MITPRKRHEILQRMGKLGAEIGCVARCMGEEENYRTTQAFPSEAYEFMHEDLYYTFTAPPLSQLELKSKEPGALNVTTTPKTPLRRVEILGHHKNEKVKTGEGYFHGFSSDYEELRGGPAQYPVAIVEDGDGYIKIMPTDMIRFVD